MTNTFFNLVEEKVEMCGTILSDVQDQVTLDSRVFKKGTDKPVEMSEFLLKAVREVKFVCSCRDSKWQSQI